MQQDGVWTGEPSITSSTPNPLYHKKLTSDAGVTGLQVRFELCWAWFGIIQLLIWYPQLAGSPAGTFAVKVRPHIGETSDIAIVCAHTLSNTHSSIPCGLHHHHFISLTHRLETLSLTILLFFCKTILWGHFIRVYEDLCLAEFDRNIV